MMASAGKGAQGVIYWIACLGVTGTGPKLDGKPRLVRN